MRPTIYSALFNDRRRVILRRVITTVFLLILLLTAVGLVLSSLRKVHVPDRRGMTVLNCKLIGLACLQYQDVHKHWPTPTSTVIKFRKIQTVDLSWRVSILNFLEEDDLKRSFDITLAWDGRENVHLQHAMPPCYRSYYRQSNQEETTLTHFQYFTGEETLFPDNSTRTKEDIQRSLSETILLAEAETPVIWSRPLDMKVERDRPLPLPEDRLFLAVMADGSARLFFRKETNDFLLRRLINPNEDQN